ncbi:hypothetical protein FB45DRAFT_1018482 [Roridomyces roridus]|uniref:Uncharacterized protein n=1 Tax=Roridomyces roridus TaxID=1738132 RepID=A0AAD7CKJ3_9AGAR|nr:hypothetical protein FB45DRAFT_1018482 [Roridomyces roridus]
MSGGSLHLTCFSLRSLPSYLASHILEHLNPILSRPSGLNIVISAIQKILGPTDKIHYKLIPDLLDFLTILELCHRLKLKGAVDEAREPRHEDEEWLQSVQTGKFRQLFIEIVLKYCELDMYRLWTQDPPIPSLATQRLREYFPVSCSEADGHTVASPRLFHSDLSGSEREEIYSRGTKCRRFIYDSIAWADAHGGRGESLATIFQSAEFQTRYPCEVDIGCLRQAVGFYVKVVQDSIDKL